MLEIKQLSAGYGKAPVLQAVTASAEAGQITAVIGPNGCGKSTLLKAICGIIPAASGSVFWNNHPVLSLPANLLAQKIAYLPQNRQVPEITVERLVLHGRFPYLSYPRRYRQQDHLAAQAAMERMELTDVAQKSLQSLSGGQQQRVYLAMALAQDTDVVLLDEPTTYMDIAYQRQTLQLARELADSGKCVIMVIHDIPAALQTADSILLLEQGAVVQQGTPQQLYESGRLDQVFGVQLQRLVHNDRWRYFAQ